MSGDGVLAGVPASVRGRQVVDVNMSAPLANAPSAVRLMDANVNDLLAGGSWTR